MIYQSYTTQLYYVYYCTRATYLFININQLDVLFFFNKFISSLYMFRAPCAHRQEGKIALYSLWYHHTETSEWSKITKIIKIIKIQFYKYENMVVQFMCEFWYYLL